MMVHLFKVSKNIFLYLQQQVINYITKQELKLSDVDQMDILVGLTETFATNPENIFTSSNIIGFLLTDGSKQCISGVTEASGTHNSNTFHDTDFVNSNK